MSLLQQAWLYNVEGDGTIIEAAEEFEGGGDVLFQRTIPAFVLRDSGKLRKPSLARPRSEPAVS
jgi:hypothetical protein